PLFPGGAGIAEAGFGFLYRRFGCDSAPAVMGMLTQRVINWVLGLVGYFVYLRMKPALRPAPVVPQEKELIAASAWRGPPRRGPPSRLSRRTFLHAIASLAAAGGMAAPSAADFPRTQPAPRPDKPRKRLAVVTTAYYYLSHAYHVCGRFLYGYLRDGK